VPPGVLDGSPLSVPHPVLDLGEGLLDRIEVGRIGWQVPKPRACGSDHAANRGRLVAAEIVQDHDIAGLEGRNELLFDVGAEALAVDGPVEHTRGAKLVAAQSAKEGQRSPVTVRRKSPYPIALRSPSPKRRHVGLDPGLVDEDQPFGIKMILQGLPSLSSASDVGTRLLKGEQRFF